VGSLLGAPTLKARIIPDETSEGEETNHLLRILSIQAVTRRKARLACQGKEVQEAERAKPNPVADATQNALAKFEDIS